jgi:hypothetical protein
MIAFTFEGKIKMLRFPNPGSDIPTFIRIFQILFSYLNEKKNFSLDDMSLTLTKMNLASSSGYMGEQALKLSTRKDRSRDPLYNQSKMYAELFRVLGWIQSSEEKKLNFNFTYLGEHMAVAKNNPLPLFQECLLGINYPNEIIDIKSNNQIRPFALILKSMIQLDGLLSRDELIIGPLSLDNEENFSSMIEKIRKIRINKNRDLVLQEELDKLSKNLGIKINTLRNYTRFPIAALKYSGWVSSEQSNLYKKNRTILKLTEEGRKRTEWINNAVELGMDFIQKEAQQDTLNKVIRVSFFRMLERSDFDITQVKDELRDDFDYVCNKFNNRELLFSPYQTLKKSKVDVAFERYLSEDITKTYETSNLLNSTLTSEEVPINKSKLKYTLKLHDSDNNINEQEEVVKKILEFRESYGDNDEIVLEKLIQEYRKADKSTFYPLVASIFRTLGFNCENPRHGINYQRWDAIIIHPQYSIPIEIKSPSEEEFISVKAVRQALENKIVLLSRKSYTTDFDTTSLAVGFYAPNDRSDVIRLIDDIHTSFGIRIGIFDISTLFRLVLQKVLYGKTIDMEQLRMLGGIIDVKDI